MSGPLRQKLGVGVHPQRQKLIAERCLGEFAPDGGTEEQKYMLAFAVNGCFGTIVAWQEAGFQPPAAEIARITWQAIRAVKGRM